MGTHSILSALNAVQAAMRAEAAAQAAFLSDRSPENQAIWNASRTHTDASWATLWSLDKTRTPAPALTGEEWARAMRVSAFDATPGNESGSTIA